MLARLSIRDIVLIERLDIEFSRGLAVLTGNGGTAFTARSISGIANLNVLTATTIVLTGKDTTGADYRRELEGAAAGESDGAVCWLSDRGDLLGAAIDVGVIGQDVDGHGPVRGRGGGVVECDEDRAFVRQPAQEPAQRGSDRHRGRSW